MSLEVLFDAARSGDDERVAQILGQHASLDYLEGATALHYAAARGHGKVVSLLLASRPELIHRTTREGSTALHSAVQMGHESVFDQLLHASPDLIAVAASDGVTVLHDAARNGYGGLVARILALRPRVAAAVTNDGWNALGFAVWNGHQSIAEQLLAAQPELIHGVTAEGDTILHLAVSNCNNMPFVAKLWRLNPRAVRHENIYSFTPFHNAIMHEKNALIELFQWSFSFDEIVTVFTKEKINYQQRYRPVMERQCEPLLAYLPLDLLGTVLEYLGFKRQNTTRQPA